MQGKRCVVLGTTALASAVAEHLRAGGASVVLVEPGSSTAEAQEAVESGVESLGGLDALVALPPKGTLGSIAETDAGEWIAASQGYVDQVFGALHAAGRVLMKQRSGRMIVVGSDAGLIGSIMIDDIEDRGEIRRGKPCSHKIFGVDVAINAGNFMYTLPTLAFIKNRGHFPDNILLDAYEIF